MIADMDEMSKPNNAPPDMRKGRSALQVFREITPPQLTDDSHGGDKVYVATLRELHFGNRNECVG